MKMRASLNTPTCASLFWNKTFVGTLEKSFSCNISMEWFLLFKLNSHISSCVWQCITFAGSFFLGLSEKPTFAYSHQNLQKVAE